MKVLYLTSLGTESSSGRRRDIALVPQLAKLADVQAWVVSPSPVRDHSFLIDGALGVPCRVHADDSLMPLADLDAFDIVHVEGDHLFRLLPQAIHCRAVLVQHGVDPDSAANEAWRQAALVLTLSEEDRDRIVRRVPFARVSSATHGVDHLPMSLGRLSRVGDIEAPAIGFVADPRRLPGGGALVAPMEQIHRGVRASLPTCRLMICGPQDSDTEMSEFWRRVDVLIMPANVGGGPRLEMFEAIRSGVLAVSTGAGLEGLPASARGAVVRADDTEALIDGVERLCRDEPLRFMNRIRLIRAQEHLAQWTDVAGAVFAHWSEVAALRPAVV